MKRFALCAAALITLVSCSSSSDSSSDTAAAGSGAASGIKVVPHETLQTFLPTLPGWTRGELKGETEAADGIARAQAEYEKPGSALTVTIMDTSMNRDLLAQMNDPSPGFSKTTVSGYPGVQEWTDAAKSGDVQILVGGRFNVSINGNAMPDLATLRAVFDAIDLKKLAALK